MYHGMAAEVGGREEEAGKEFGAREKMEGPIRRRADKSGKTLRNVWSVN
jgi:hypothetical protein